MIMRSFEKSRSACQALFLAFVVSLLAPTYDQYMR